MFTRRTRDHMRTKHTPPHTTVSALYMAIISFVSNGVIDLVSHWKCAHEDAHPKSSPESDQKVDKGM